MNTFTTDFYEQRRQLAVQRDQRMREDEEFARQLQAQLQAESNANFASYQLARQLQEEEEQNLALARQLQEEEEQNLALARQLQEQEEQDFAFAQQLQNAPDTY